jgi:molecular chaperone GrpE
MTEFGQMVVFLPTQIKMKNIFNMFNNDSTEEPVNKEINSEETSENSEKRVDITNENPEVETLNETEKLQNEVIELNEKYLRLYSDFENFKRRTFKERMELMQTANQEMMLAVIPILDDFERAMKSFELVTEVAPLIEGLELINQKFKNTLQQKGLKSLESIGQPFNIDLHEAITNLPVEDESKKGTIIDEVERGYMLGDKVIRFAKVVVAS